MMLHPFRLTCAIYSTLILVLSAVILFIILYNGEMNTVLKIQSHMATPIWNQYGTPVWNQNGNVRELYRHRRTVMDRKLQSLTNDQMDDFNLEPNFNKMYAVSLKYQGQQGAGVRAIASLQCFLGSLDQHFSILEPYIEETNFRGYSTSGSQGDDQEDMKFSDFFNFDHFNAASRKKNYAELVKMEEFSNHSPKYVILVVVRSVRVNRVIWTSEFESSDRVKCLGKEDMNNMEFSDRKKIRVLRNRMLKIKSDGKCIVRVIALTSRNAKQHPKFTPQSINKFIFHKWSPQEVMLIFELWSGPYSIPVATTNGMDCRQDFHTNGTKLQFQPSERLMEDARRYEETFLGRRIKVAIMMRVERALQFLEEKREQKTKKNFVTLNQCFQKVLDLRDEIENRLGGPQVPLVTMDAGRYGSHTFKKTKTKAIVDLSNETLLALYHREWSYEKWERSFIQATGEEVLLNQYNFLCKSNLLLTFCRWHH